VPVLPQIIHLRIERRVRDIDNYNIRTPFSLCCYVNFYHSTTNNPTLHNTHTNNSQHTHSWKQVPKLLEDFTKHAKDTNDGKSPPELINHISASDFLQKKGKTRTAAERKVGCWGLAFVLLLSNIYHIAT
jgi:hypothetical protein